MPHDLNPWRFDTVAGESKSGIEGFAKGIADVTLTVGGKIAQLGSRLTTSTSKELAGRFFPSFNERVSG